MVGRYCFEILGIHMKSMHYKAADKEVLGGAIIAPGLDRGGGGGGGGVVFMHYKAADKGVLGGSISAPGLDRGGGGGGGLPPPPFD